MSDQQPPQIFREVQQRPVAARLPNSTIAIYTLPGFDSRGRALTLAVECLEGGSNVPQNATSLRDIANQLDLEPEFDAIVAMSNLALDKLKALRPGSVSIEFGIELGGEFGIPLVTKGEGKANFKVVMTWENTTKAPV